MTVDEPGATAIVVLSREAEPVVGGIFAEHTHAGRDGMSPHVTLLVPFVPERLLDAGIEERMRRLFSRFEAFDYALARFASFDHVFYLVPEPSDPFVDLVIALSAEFPDYPPYGGVHDDVIPHVTIADTDEAALVDRIGAEVQPRLPIACRALEATLVVRGVDLRWRPRTSFAFGSLE